jgi:hypothetical protein
MTPETPPLTADEVRAALEKQMTAQEAETTARYAALADQAALRLNWAPALANGAAVVALAGIVGNVPSPDTALTALSWPLGLFSLGAGLGLASIYLLADVYGVLGSARLTMEANRAAMLEIVDESAALTKGVTPENSQERIAKAAKLPAKAKPIEDSTLALGRRVRGLKLRTRAAAILNGASIVAAACGMGILLIGHAMGRLRLEHPTPPAAAGPQVARPHAPLRKGTISAPDLRMSR